MSHLHHKVSALIDGELSPGARDRAMRHARRCEQCRREIAETLEVKQRVTSLAPTEVSFDLRQMVASISPTAPLPQPSPGLGLAIRRVAFSLGSMSAVVLSLAYVAGAPEASQASPVSPPVNEFAAEFTDTTAAAPLGDPAVAAAPSTPIATTTPISFGSPSQTWRPVTGTGPLPGSGDDPAAIDLLRNAVRAPDKVAFKGLRVCQSYAAGEVESFAVEVRHVPRQGTRYDIRGSDQQHDSTLFIGAGDPGEGVLAGRSIERLAAAYDVTVAGSQRLLGRHTTVVQASQGGQVRAEFWIDNATGLLLKREMYAGGKLIRSSGFTSIRMTQHGFMQHLPQEIAVPPSRRLAIRIAAVLTDRGWTYPARLGGDFRLSMLRQVSTAGGVVRADYTDGLSTVAVFEERGSLDSAALAGFRSATVAGNPVYVRDGLPMVLVWQSGDTVFTVVTDLPAQLASALVARFPTTAEPSAPGLTHRFGKGLSRLVSAVAP